MPVEKRWGPSQERDLAIAIIMSQAGDRPKYNWERVTEIMTNWGHGFTRDAINQHWSKRIMKEFKERHGEAATKGGPSASTSITDSPNGCPASSKSALKTPGTGTPASGKRKKKSVATAHHGDDNGNEGYGCDSFVDETPTKKQRKTKVEAKQDEEQC